MIGFSIYWRLEKTGGRFSRLPVVVVDDDPYIAEVFTSILNSAGFNTKVFINSDEVIQFAKKTLFRQ